MQLPFDDATIKRYSRQILLREVGGTGLRRLMDAHVGTSNEVAARYLRAAGLSVELRPEPRGAIEKWLQGSFEAVETVKRVLGVGKPGQLELP